MTIRLPADLEDLVRAEVRQGGHFATADELVAEAVRHYMHEHAQQVAQSAAAHGDAPAQPRKPIWEIADEIRKGVPENEWAKLPSDGAAQHDHYIYGTPKRPTT